MRKKILCFLLVALMAVSLFAGCATGKTGGKSGGAKNENKVIVGNITSLAGEFRWPDFTGANPSAADVDVNQLTVGCGTMEIDKKGSYVWSKTVVKKHSEKEDADGNLVITVEINPGLTFSDGSEIKAQNYIAGVLAFSTPVAVNAKNPGQQGQYYVGFRPFSLYTGEGCPSEVPVLDEEGNEVKKDGKTVMEPVSHAFKGIRLLSDYQFSVTVSAPDFYPYYFAKNYGAFTPDPLPLILGDGVEIKDDGEGAYLTDSWYEKAEDSTPEAPSYKKSAHLSEARFDINTYPYSGPYVIKEFDKGTKQAVLELNPKYPGDFDGQKPSIKTVVYTLIIEETQLDQLKSGEIDVLSAITGGDATKAALQMMKDNEGQFNETHYQRAGYGKIQFECDFGPTMFTEVRQAIAYLLNRAEFCQTFTGGYGVVVDGPYSPDFGMYQAVKDDLNITKYEYSPANAKKVLEDGGWIYNSKGQPFTEGGEGVDSVRYKKLEGIALKGVHKEVEGVNQAYESVANVDGITYKTVKVGNDYYMPLAINWFGTQPNSVTDLLATTLSNSKELKDLGMVIRSTTGDFDALIGQINRAEEMGYSGTPIYGMYNLATGWTTADYDYAFNWSLKPEYFPYSANKLFDDYDRDFPYDEHSDLSFDDAMKESGNKLGMDYLSMAMVYTATTEKEYNQWWKAYIERWNYLQPDIPLYSNYYYDVYNAKLEDYVTGPFWSSMRALVYAKIANAE